MPAVRTVQEARANKHISNKETAARNKKVNLTNLTKFELYKAKYPQAEYVTNGQPLPRSSLTNTPSNKFLAQKYNVDPKTVTNILNRGYDYWANMTKAELQTPKTPRNRSSFNYLGSTDGRKGNCTLRECYSRKSQ